MSRTLTLLQVEVLKCRRAEEESGLTDLVVGARRHHGVDHLARVVDAGDGQLAQGAGELNCGRTHSESPQGPWSSMDTVAALFSDLPGL